jgi:tRNA (cmo5U34)-methyltransferase
MGKKMKYIPGKLTGDRMTKKDRKVAKGYRQVASSRMPFMPEYNYPFDLAAEFIALNIPRGSRIMDLGAGTGNFTKTVFTKHAFCSCDLVDFSKDMLDMSHDVLGKYKGRFQTRTADIFTAEYKKNSYNAIISSLALHHGRGEKVYYALYKRIFSAIKPKGVFVCLDVVKGASVEIENFFMEKWREHLSSNFTRGDIDKLFKNYKLEDSPIPIARHLALLSKAGFKKVEVLWKKHNFAIYTAIK